ncbi:Clavaminate synthase-like protein [Massarina eburnea CBS 473.64]|uniref:Clavaminate synthase-like protein n=1 Tax=Massarina eburnea CBS 473.64 TaxID=1395130 RepID=A0A6A6S8E2_9PLEO|nr:Clavaminate synthase-like protein [Massarina eburnea CBS 473.64]
MSGSLAVPAISLKNFDTRKDEITQQLVEAAEKTGFFTLVDHGITIDDINSQFAKSEAYFALPHEVKARIPHDIRTNNGWEYKSQIRQSTGTADQKESLWIQRDSEWPTDEEVPNFRDTTKRFMGKCEEISKRVLACFSTSLGFSEDHLNKAMDVEAPDNLSQMRLLHYMASEDAVGTWRAGNHTDIGCLTLLFQRDGEDGLEICPGRESHNDHAIGDTFYPLPAETGPIVVNIGDMLMAWSDDRFKANFHHVRAKDIGKSPDRYSIAYFNAGRKNVIMQGPLKRQYVSQ